MKPLLIRALPKRYIEMRGHVLDENDEVMAVYSDGRGFTQVMHRDAAALAKRGAFSSGDQICSGLLLSQSRTPKAWRVTVYEEVTNRPPNTTSRCDGNLPQNGAATSTASTHGVGTVRGFEVRTHFEQNPPFGTQMRSCRESRTKIRAV